MLLLSINEILKEIEEKFRHSPAEIKEVLIFGSVARGDYKQFSDVDLAVVYSDYKVAKEFAEDVADYIYLKYSVPVTVIYIDEKDFLSNRTSFIRTIKCEGKVIWRRD